MTRNEFIKKWDLDPGALLPTIPRIQADIDHLKEKLNNFHDDAIDKREIRRQIFVLSEKKQDREFVVDGPEPAPKKVVEPEPETTPLPLGEPDEQ